MNKRIDLSELPRRGNSNQIDWKNSVGKKCKFFYKNISGIVKIIGYDEKIQKLSVLYENNSYDIGVKHFKEAAFGRIVGLFGYDDIDVGYEKNNVVVTEIVDTTNKIIKYKCKKCGESGEMKANPFKYSKNPCHVCAGRTVVVGKNDLFTSNPRLASMLKNENDGYSVTERSCKKLWFVCPHCGKEIYKSPNQINNSFPCDKCKDNHSYGERFMAALLKNKNIEFVQEYKFDWSGLKRYDFYLPLYNLIIETHGEQHYKSTFKNIGGRSLEQEQENDMLKKQLALNNGITRYIVIDTRKSEFDYVKHNILESELKDIFELTDNDFDIIPDMIMTNNSVTMKRLKDIGFTIKMIEKYMNIHESTVIDGLNKFEKNVSNSTGSYLDSKIILINNMKIYNSVSEASTDTGVHINGIVNCCNGVQSYAGTDEKNRRMKWIYMKDYIELYKNANKG